MLLRLHIPKSLKKWKPIAFAQKDKSHGGTKENRQKRVRSFQWKSMFPSQVPFWKIFPIVSSSASRFSSFVSPFVYRHDSVSTQTPVYAKPMFCVSSSCFPLRLSLQCAGFHSAHASRNMRMFFFDPISIVVLAIGLLCHSYTFYVPIPHTDGLSVHLLLCRTPFTRATFLCMAFSKNLGSHTASV